MEEEFTPYEEALALKELGYNKPCIGYFQEYYSFPIVKPGEGHNVDLVSKEFAFSHCEFLLGRVSANSLGVVMAPTLSQAFRWFREKYDVICHIHKPRGQGYTTEHYFDIWPKDMDDYKKWNGKDSIIPTDYYNSYEEAELACLKRLIKTVKEKK